MIRERLLRLREARAGLVMRADEERRSLDQILARVDRVSQWAALAARWVSFLRRRPWIVMGSVAAVVGVLIVVKPRRLLSLASAGWTLYRLWRGAQPWMRRIVALRGQGLSA